MALMPISPSLEFIVGKWARRAVHLVYVVNGRLNRSQLQTRQSCRTLHLRATRKSNGQLMPGISGKCFRFEFQRRDKCAGGRETLSATPPISEAVTLKQMPWVCWPEFRSWVPRVTCLKEKRKKDSRTSSSRPVNCSLLPFPSWGLPVLQGRHTLPRFRASVDQRPVGEKEVQAFKGLTTLLGAGPERRSLSNLFRVGAGSGTRRQRNEESWWKASKAQSWHLCNPKLCRPWLLEIRIRIKGPSAEQKRRNRKRTWN